MQSLLLLPASNTQVIYESNEMSKIGSHRTKYELGFSASSGDVFVQNFEPNEGNRYYLAVTPFFSYYEDTLVKTVAMNVFRLNETSGLVSVDNSKYLYDPSTVSVVITDASDFEEGEKVVIQIAFNDASRESFNNPILKLLTTIYGIRIWNEDSAFDDDSMYSDDAIIFLKGLFQRYVF